MGQPCKRAGCAACHSTHGRVPDLQSLACCSPASQTSLSKFMPRPIFVPSRISHRCLSTSIAVCLTLGFAANQAKAGNLWDGGGANGNWSTVENWDSDTLPTLPGALTFDGVTNVSTVNDL